MPLRQSHMAEDDMTDAPKKVGGILDGIANILIENSDLSNALRGPLADLNAAVADWAVAVNAFHDATGKAVVATQKTQEVIASFEAVLVRYGLKASA
jgi:hypothetical protein